MAADAMSLVQQLQGLHARIEGHRRLLDDAEAHRRAFLEEHKHRVRSIKAALAADRELEAHPAAALASSSARAVARRVFVNTQH